MIHHRQRIVNEQPASALPQAVTMYGTPLLSECEDRLCVGILSKAENCNQAPVMRTDYLQTVLCIYIPKQISI